MNSPELENLTLFLNSQDPKGVMMEDYLKIREKLEAYEEIFKNILLCSKNKYTNETTFYITFENHTGYLDTIKVSEKCYKTLIKNLKEVEKDKYIQYKRKE